MRLSEPKRTFTFGSNSSNAKAKTEIGPPLIDRDLYSDKARSFNQLERALYRNFIINPDTEQLYLTYKLGIYCCLLLVIFWRFFFYQKWLFLGVEQTIVR